MYETLFSASSFTVNPVHIIMLIISSVLIFLYIRNKNKKKPSVILQLASTIVFIAACVFSIISTTSFNQKCYNMLTKNRCFIAEGKVSEFITDKSFGKITDSFYIDGELFTYSNEIGKGYTKTKSNGGVITGNGQHLRISYIKKDGRNIILKIEEAKTK